MAIVLEVIGWMGTCSMVGAYYGVSSGKLKADSLTYQWMNFLGAGAVAVSVFVKNAWPAFALEAVWAGIALLALLRLSRGR